jgi:5'-deoxynucleotidase YfbR-like HD superfamily hydrolase
MKKCKSCGKQFEPSNTIQSVCGLKCALKVSAAKTKKKEVEKKKLNLKLKESLKTLGDYKKELQIEVNKIVRLIDEGCKCLACGVTNAKFDASHFRGVGAWDNLRFNLHNIYSGCARCNTYQNGNLIKFREGIIETFGDTQIAYMDDLNVIYPIVKLNKDELAERTKIAKKAVKELIELNKSAKLPRIADERIALRTKFNKMLDIYL